MLQTKTVNKKTVLVMVKETEGAKENDSGSDTASDIEGNRGKNNESYSEVEDAEKSKNTISLPRLTPPRKTPPRKTPRFDSVLYGQHIVCASLFIIVYYNFRPISLQLTIPPMIESELPECDQSKTDSGNISMIPSVILSIS